MYKLIFTSEDYEWNGRKAGGLPFMIDENGVPLDEFNQYVLYLATQKWRNREKTIRPIAYNVKNLLNKIEYIERKKGFRWDRITDNILTFVMEGLSKYGDENNQQLQNETINDYISDFIGWLWWVEHTKKLRAGLIGINDLGKSKVKYRVALEPSKQRKRKYEIPFLMPATKGPKRLRGDSADWDAAIDMVVNNNNDPNDFKALAMSHRDEILIRLLRESSLRRIEAVYLEADQFRIEPRKGEKKVYITLKRTKLYDSRDISIHVDGLWQDIQVYIKTSLKILLPESKKGQPLIPSASTGNFFHPDSINTLLKKYGIRPHDGRAVGLTESFIEYIEDGVPQEEAMFLVSQQAGHSLKYDNKTLLKHYLIAKEICRRASRPPRSSLEAQNIRLKRHLAETKAKLKHALEENKSFRRDKRG
jgi:hypothetical protein